MFLIPHSYACNYMYVFIRNGVSKNILSVYVLINMNVTFSHTCIATFAYFNQYNDI